METVAITQCRGLAVIRADRVDVVLLNREHTGVAAESELQCVLKKRQDLEKEHTT